LQCLAAQKNINEIDIRVVFVSPLQRTLQTAIEMFKEHPNLKNIKFIVLPLCREILRSA